MPPAGSRPPVGAARRLPFAEEPFDVVVPSLTLHRFIGALERPDVFGNVLSQSGSYFWKPEDDEEYEWLPRRYAARERLPVRFSLDVGLLENDYAGPSPAMGNSSRRPRSFTGGTSSAPGGIGGPDVMGRRAPSWPS